MNPRRLVAAALTTLALGTLSYGVRAQQFDARLVSRLARTTPSIIPLAGDNRVSLHVSGWHGAKPAGPFMRLTKDAYTIRLKPDQIGSFLASHPGITLSWSPPLFPTLDQAQKWTGAASYRTRSGMTGVGVAVGIVDTGIDPRHPSLRNQDGSTRIAWMLDMSRGPCGVYPELEKMYGCSDPRKGGCCIWGAEQINQALRPASPILLPNDAMGHGTHVASIAAGNGRGSKDRRLAGMAPQATLLAAIVARRGAQAVTDEDALLAAKFLFEQADRMNVPIVVNASLGRDFGPHDGSSWLEEGLATFVGPNRPGHALVVAAGNSGTLYLDGERRYGIHTQLRVAPGTVYRASAKIPATNVSRVSGELFVWISWQPGDSISVGVKGPGPVEIEPVSAGSSVVFREPEGATDPEIQAMVLHSIRVPDEPLISGTPGALVYIKGNWAAQDGVDILLEGSGTADLWLQGTGDAGMSLSSMGYMFVRALKDDTVNVPGNHPAILTVGATLDRVAWLDKAGQSIELAKFGTMEPPMADSVAYFSGAGPTSSGVIKPDLVAPGVLVAGAVSSGADPSHQLGGMFVPPQGLCPGKENCLMVEDGYGLASGTSMAAPMVTGAIALLLQREPTLTQDDIRALLQAGARYPQGEVPFACQLGAGALNVDGAARVLVDMRRHPVRIPDPGKSWLTIPASYARPDPSWPVCGLLQLRDSKDLPAVGFDTNRLALLVQGGKSTGPLRYRAPGLWTFCVAVPERAGGKKLRIEATFDGKRLGHVVVLPVGADAHLATHMPLAQGGCSLSAVGSRGRAPWEWLAVAWGLVLWHRRNHMKKRHFSR